MFSSIKNSPFLFSKLNFDFENVVTLQEMFLMKFSLTEEPKNEELKPFDLNVRNYLVPPLFLSQPNLPNSVNILIMVTSAPKNYQARNDINRARVYWTSVKEKVIYFLENLKVVKIHKLVQLLQISYEAGSGITT